MTAEDPSTGNQTTTYIYGVSTATGSNITSNDLLYQTIYPATAGTADTASTAYTALSQVAQTTDRNGNVHQYTYDTAGREISDTVTTLGANVDGSVRRIDTAYNPQGLAYLYTSYADTAGTQIVNQVENIYNGLDQVAFQYQALTGAVDVGSTPFVEYIYSSPTNGSRLASMVYPNGRTINYDYGSDLTNTNAALDNAIGRLDAIVDGANSGDTGQVLEQYSYLGLSTIVARNHPQTGINQTLIGSAGSIGSGGDQYVGLDQFGRIVDQNWINTSTGQSTDNFTYSYDGNSNVTADNNLLDTAYSQTFAYDPLNRLASNTLGGAANQSWTLDSQGNWSSFTSNGTTQTQTANAQNEITTVSGLPSPVYDANGNMTTDQAGNTYAYNAWNQLVEVKNSSGQVIAQYTYSALGYRITESYPAGGNPGAPGPGTVKYLYYSNQEQVIEERWNGTAKSNTQYQYVWSASYVNAMILRDTYSGGSLQANDRIYTTYDANYDVTSLIGYNATTQTWGVVERFAYSPYGTVTVLSPDGTTSTDVYSWQYMYQGGRQDPITQLYHFDHRDYSTSLGRFISQDPLQYINGANTYQFVMSNPVGNVDPWGLDVVYNGMDLGSTTPNSQSTDVSILVVGPDVSASYHFGLGFDYVIHENGDLGGLLKQIQKDVGPNGHIKELVLDGHGITDHRATISPERYLTLTAVSNGSKFSRVPILRFTQIGTEGKNGTPDPGTKYFFQHLPMDPQGQIMLYGCNSAAGPSGRNFIQNLANITDVPVTGFQNEVNPLFFDFSVIDNPQWITRNPDNW